MANDCINKLVFLGDNQVIKNLLKKAHTKNAFGGESIFTFHAFVPMPPEVYRGSIGTEERRLYPGDRNRYDWSIKHWGTKCDAYMVSVNVYTVRFCTAWSPPIPVLKAISNQHKEIAIQYSLEDPSIEISMECLFKDGKLYYQRSVIQRLLRYLWR